MNDARRNSHCSPRKPSSLLATRAIEQASTLTRRVELLPNRARPTGTGLAGVALVPLILALCAALVPHVIAFESPNASIVSCSSGGALLVCRDKDYKVSFVLPQGWSVQSSLRWGNLENTVHFNDPQAIAGQRNPSLWYTVRPAPLNRTPEQTLEGMQRWSEDKVIQRQRSGLVGYHMRPNSCHARNVGSLPGWSCIGEFTDQSGRAMAEYLTWTDSGNAGAEFFGVIPASGLDSYVKRLDAIIETLQIP